MKFYGLAVALFISAMISSCAGHKSHAGEISSLSADSVGVKYGIKSGIIEYKSEMAGKEARQTLTFDDYGKKELTETVINISNLKITTVSLARDGIIYTFNPDTKTGTKVETQGRQSSVINFMNLTEDRRRKMNLHIVDTVTIDERTCIKYSVDWVEMSMTGIYTVWKGITLESETRILNTDIKMTATTIVENPVLPSGRFDLPSDIRLN